MDQKPGDERLVGLRISVIIALLGKHLHCLKDYVASLATQTLSRSEYEVILVNAESDSNVDSAVNAVASSMPDDFNCHYFKISKRGRAAALNHGVEQSAANILLLYASDFIATPKLLEHHLTLHEQNSDSKMVGIGPVMFHPRIQVTPFMRWLDESGALFGTQLTPNSVRIPEKFFYGANTSVMKDFLKSAGPFNEVFLYDSVDDYEMGVRLYKQGMKNVYLPEALAYHDHQVSIEERRRAMLEAGESTAIWDFRNPHSMLRPRGYHWQACIAKLLTPWFRTSYSLFGREQDLWKYYGLSMMQDWVDAYQSTAKHLRA